jgi:plasmid stabilization system protein ParE
MDVRFHPLADAEYWHEVHHYSKISEELGTKFTKAVADTIDRLERNPYLCHNRGDGVFSVRIKGFPFTLFFEIFEDEILVTCFFMQIRNPEIWKSRKGLK